MIIFGGRQSAAENSEAFKDVVRWVPLPLHLMLLNDLHVFSFSSGCSPSSPAGGTFSPPPPYRRMPGGGTGHVWGIQVDSRRDIPLCCLVFLRFIFITTYEGGRLVVAGGRRPALPKVFIPTSGMELSDGGRTARSTGSAQCATIVNQGFSKGKAMWEFQIKVDEAGNEMVAFGAAIKPLRSE